MSEITSSESAVHSETCHCPACMGQHDNEEEGGASAGYVAPQPGGNGDGTVGVDQVLGQLVWGDSLDWKEGSATIPQITYSYAYSNWGFGSGNVSGGQLLDAAQLAANEQAIHAWENVANINLVETNNGDATNIVFRQGNLPSGTAGLATWVWNQAGTVNKHVDVAYQKGNVINPDAGTYAYQTMLHEIGHALGLYHAGNYNGGGAVGGNTFFDNRDVSLMSYFNGAHTGNGNWPSSPMLYDIAAIQAIYGANTSYHSGDDTYVIDGSKTSYCIWDGGGNDTLSVGAADTTCVIDLREGQLNVSEVGQSNVWVAFNASIENAEGGSATDFLYGNALGNVLSGNGGADQITGGAGEDTLVGGAGNDVFRFTIGDGKDTVADGEAGDVISVGNTPINGIATVESEGVYHLTVGGTIYVLMLEGLDLLLGYSGWDNAITMQNFDNGDFGILLEDLGGPPDSIIEGTPQSDTLYGTDGNDTIYARASNDTVDGGYGNDTIYGEAGNDTLHGRDDNDKLYGDEGDDELWGDKGDDILYGGDGNDMLHAGAGNDTLHGGDGNDHLGGDDSGSDKGNDLLYGDAGDDTIGGLLGNDTLYGGEGNDWLDGGYGNDTLYGGRGNDGYHLSMSVYRGEIENAECRFEIGDGQDTIFQENGSAAEPHNNTIFIGASHIAGTAQKQTDGAYKLNVAGTNYTLAWAGTSLVLSYGATDTITITNFASGDFGILLDETVATPPVSTGPTPGPDVLRGTPNKDVIDALAGDDNINGLGDDDLLYGNDGNDNVAGNTGNDTCYGGNGNDMMGGDDGDDYMYGDDGNDTITGGDGNDVVRGGADNDTITGGAGFNVLDGETGDDKVTGGDNIDLIYGGAGNDTLTGGKGDDIITGGAGNDTIRFNTGDGTDRITDSDAGDRLVINAIPVTGAAQFVSGNSYLLSVHGVDYSLTLNGTVLTLSFGGGADRMLIENFTDGDFGITLVGGTPLPTVTGTEGDDTLRGGVNGDVVSGLGGKDNINGKEGDDILYGGAGDDKVAGSTGNDTCYGGADNDIVAGDDGDDVVYGDDGVDTVNGGNGNDTCYGGEGTDTITGGAGLNVLDGGAGDDKLVGGDDSDTLIGGDGNDRMIGGAGADVFQFIGASGVDVITDFQLGVDKLDVFGDPNAILAGVIYDADSALVTLSTGNTVDLLGITGGLTLGDLI